ncbi:Alpha/Beta hydrolase protein [Phaeosphaeria sp. MPI-PUGE-AT-0046c]|nr:Alpha/Beta hydrolase protein [Phaeosphaeria sp. MPI-PUGE-AT-0046c]
MASTGFSIAHPTLGCTLRGKPSSTTTTVQFRNLKYASVPARFQDSIPNDFLDLGSDGIYDATKFGPSCPHKRGAQAWDLTLVGNVSLPCEDGQGNSEAMDDLECLHVNVTVPKSALSSSQSDMSALPVFVWVHGGGLSVGSNNWPQYDLQKLVERSVEIGKPVVAVALNYRLGLFGFAASEELGAPGNMGYKDQVLAFRWVKKHIAGFRGDPGNITAAGESAGGISLSTLISANVGAEGLFDRVVIMSGDATLRKPRNKWWHRQFYQEQAKTLDVSTTDAAALRVKLLRTGAEELAQQLPFANHFCGYVDGSWLKTDINIKVLANGTKAEHKPDWCKDFVIGDCPHDGTILKARILDHPKVLNNLQAACLKYLTESETVRLLAAYNLNHELSSDQAREMLLCLATDLRFYDPVLRAHKGWKSAGTARSASRCHFHVANPFEGNFKGLMSHELDVAFLLQNFNDQLDEKNRQVAQAMADHFIEFANGKAWAASGKLVVFGHDGVQELDEEEYDQVHRQGRGQVLASIDAEKLWNLAEMWQGVRSENDEHDGLANLRRVFE